MPNTAPALPPNPSLVALLLVIRNRSGPRFVFHYPASPSLTSQKSPDAVYDDESSASDDETATTVSEEEDSTDRHASSIAEHSTVSGSKGTRADTATTGSGLAAGGSSKASVRRPARTLREDGPIDDEEDDVPELSLGPSKVFAGLNGAGRSRAGSGNNENGGASGGRYAGDERAEWESVLGFSTEGLEKLLAPGRDLSKKRFEVILDGAVFLGYPVFVREDGLWRKRRVSKEKNKSQDARPNQLRKASEASIDGTGIDIDGTNQTRNGSESMHESNNVSTSYHSQGGDSQVPSEGKSSSISSANSSDDMIMFHVVFVMNPPPLEYHVRVADMYDNVVKKFAKALKYEQASTAYLSKEAAKMLALKTQGKENCKMTSGIEVDILY